VTIGGVGTTAPNTSTGAITTSIGTAGLAGTATTDMADRVGMATTAVMDLDRVVTDPDRVVMVPDRAVTDQAALATTTITDRSAIDTAYRRKARLMSVCADRS
jgi:hypothetical protein